MPLIRWNDAQVSDSSRLLNRPREALKVIEQLDSVGWRWQGKGFTPKQAHLESVIDMLPCGKCGSVAVVLVYLDYHADPSGKAATQEVYCANCGSYSSYDGYD